MALSISVIILNWNGKQDTLSCLQSLEDCREISFDTIVVDNGSTDGSQEAIKKRFPQIKLIENNENLGFAEGNNVGIREALTLGADLIFLLNNDTVVSPTLLNAFLEEFQRHPEAGILGAKIYLFEEKNRLDHLGGMWNRRTATFDYIGHRQLDEPLPPQEIDYVCGAGMMIRRQVFDTIGLLEPRYFLIWEESDFCFRAKRAGWTTRTCPQAKLWHKVSASFVGGKPHSTYFWWRNRLLWIERNCSTGEKWSIYLRVILPDVFHMLKIYLLKRGQLSIQTLFQSQKSLQEKKQKLLKTRAALCGVRDYLFRRFGNGPRWIYTLRG